MYNPDTDMLFPVRAIPSLKDLREKPWADLVQHIEESEEASSDQLGFVLLMVRLGGCTSCHADSYRAMRGCTQCSQQTIRRFRGSDRELVERFEKSRNEMEKYQEKRANKGKRSPEVTPDGRK